MARTQYRPLQQEVWVNGQPIVYEASGSPEPLVLLHGLAGSSRWWSGSVPALSRHYQVFLIDLPGFGRLAHHRFHLADAVAWVHTWMEAIGLARANIVGHSMGGFISIQLAARWPEKVNRLVLVNAAGVSGRRGLAACVLPLFQEVRHVFPKY